MTGKIVLGTGSQMTLLHGDTSAALVPGSNLWVKPLRHQYLKLSSLAGGKIVVLNGLLITAFHTHYLQNFLLTSGAD